MKHNTAFRAALLASAMLSPLAGMAQTIGQAANQSGVADAIRVLLDQATYWRTQYQPEKADEALARVLTLDPRNPDGLALQAQIAADRGNQQLARASLAKLQAARPDDPRIAVIEQTLRQGPIDATSLAQVRQLASSGKPAEAIEGYRKLFRGDVPPASLAVEYYQTLATVDGQREAGKAGLANVIRANPQDLRAQLAYAEQQTYTDDGREDGLRRLNLLAQNPAVAEQANRDLRQVLFWLPPTSNSLPQLEQYLARNPGDTEIAERANLARGDGSQLRLAGFDDLEHGKLADAERNFNAAIAKNSQDADAIAGLGLVRMRQSRTADGRALLRRAVEIDPGKASQFQPMIDGTPAATGSTAGSYAGGNTGGRNVDYAAEAGRRIRGQYAEVAALTRRGEYAAAEQRLRALMGRRPNTGNYLQLADIQARAGKLPEAEASYRQALRGAPRNTAALGGLGSVLQREGKTAEAAPLLAQAGQSGGGGNASAEAASLRRQAQNTPDPAQKIALLRSAVSADPASPWLRLELARALQGAGQPDEARTAMAPVTGAARPTTDQLRAGIYYADGARDYPLAASLVRQLPAQARTPEMRDVLTRAEVGTELDGARGQSGSAMAARFASLAREPDPTGARGTAFAQALVKAGNKAGARDVIRAALAARAATPQQRVAYAGALLGAGYPDDAQAVTAGLQRNGLTPLDSTRLAEVRDNAAIYSADNLNGKGKAADAFDQLAPRLQRNPESPELNMALGRLYESEKKPQQALRINEALLRQNPSSLAVRMSTASAAMAAGDLGRARDLLDDAKQQFPDEPQVWMMSAQLARVRGDSGRALADLRTARSLRRQQLDATGQSDIRGLFERGPAGLAAGPPVRLALNVPPNTASDVATGPVLASAPAQDVVSREYQPYAEVAQYVNPFRPAPVAPPAVQAPAPADPALQRFAADQPTFANPFRTTGAGLGDEPLAVPSILGNRPPAAPVREPDALTQDIDASIRQVSNDVAPRLEGSVVLRGRSGDEGLAKLFDLSAPIEASYSPGGYGRLKVAVTPTFLYAGTASAANNRQNFGTNPLFAAANLPVPSARNQTAGGAALDVGYAYGPVSADVGSTALGFRKPNVVGGIEYAPRINDFLTLRIVGDRRAVTDSLLSYAGARDELTGRSWGGVTRNRGHIQAEGLVGNVNYYAGVGGGVLLGHDVKSNTEIDAGAGFSLPVYTDPTKEVRVGTDLVYFGYDKNLGGFTYGNGGYFSPNYFFAVLFPVNFRHQPTPNLVYNVGGSIGFQTFRANSQQVFPNNPVLQSALEVVESVTNNGTATRLSGFHGSGAAGGAHGDIDYHLTDNLHIGAKAGFDRSGNFTEGTGLVYARYVFNDPL